MNCIHYHTKFHKIKHKSSLKISIMEEQERLKLIRECKNPLNKSLNDVLQGKNIQKIFEEVLSIETFEATDLEAFDKFFNCEKINNEKLKELYLEAFVKISGIELLLNNEIKRLNLRNSVKSDIFKFNSDNPLLFSNKCHFNKYSNKQKQEESIDFKKKLRKTKNSKILFKESDIPFQSYKIYEFSKKIACKDESKVAILSYLVCIDKNQLYSGEYEIFYLLDYLLKGDIGCNKEDKDTETNILKYNLNSGNSDNSGLQNLNISKFNEEQEVKQCNESERVNNILIDGKETQTNFINQDIESLIDLPSEIEKDSSDISKRFNLSSSTDKTENKNIRSKILVNWAKNCTKKSSINDLVSFNLEEFFSREVLFLNDFDSLIEIIKIKKSHEILYLRLKFILSSLNEKHQSRHSISQPGMIDSTSEGLLRSGNNSIQESTNNQIDYRYYVSWLKKAICNIFKYSRNSEFSPDLSVKEHIPRNTKTLASIIIDSFKEYSPYTECILMDLNSEYITNQLIYKTKKCIPCFFVICKTVNPIYIECLNICIDRLDLMSDSKLIDVVNCPLFKVNAFEGFKAIVLRLKDKKQELPLNTLLGKIKDIKITRTLNLNTDETISWKHELTRRINFIADFIENKNLLITFARYTLTSKNVDESVSLIFKIKNFDLFKTGFNHLVVKRDELLSSVNRELLKREFCVFYYKVVRFLVKYKYLKSLDFFDSSPYSEAIKKKLLKSESIKNNLKNFENHKSKLNKEMNEKTIKYQNIGLSKGLYFNNSHLKIDSVYKKFVMAIEFTIYKEYLEDITLLHLGSEISLEIENGDIKVIQNGLSRILVPLSSILNPENSLEEKQSKLPPDFGVNTSQIKSTREIKNDDQQNDSILSSSLIENSNQETRESVTASILRAGNLLKTLTNINLGSLINNSKNNKLTPISLKFIITNTGKKLIIELVGFGSLDILSYKITSIYIGEKFNGVLNTLLYSETIEIFPEFLSAVKLVSDADEIVKRSLFLNTMTYYNQIIKPMDQLLDYKGRKGIYIDRKGMFNLGKSHGKKFILKRNILEI